MSSFRSFMPRSLPVFATAAMVSCLAAHLAAADPVLNPVADNGDDIRIAPEIMVGTAGFEPGVALEYRVNEWNIRPEAFLSEDIRVGAGLAALYDFGNVIDLGGKSSLGFGPRLVYHNSDKNGWEGDAMAEYSYSLDDAPVAFKQAVGLLGDLGIREHKENGDHKLELGASVGAFYSFRF